MQGNESPTWPEFVERKKAEQEDPKDRALKLALETLEQARGALAYVAVGNATENPNLARSTCSHGVFKIDKAEPTIRSALAEQPAQQQAVAEGVKQQALDALNRMQSILMMSDGRHPRDVLRAYIQLTAAPQPKTPQPEQQQEPEYVTNDGSFTEDELALTNALLAVQHYCPTWVYDAIEMDGARHALALEKIKELEATLAEAPQPAQQEPAAVYAGESLCGSVVRLYEDLPLETPLYTSPPAQQDSETIEQTFTGLPKRKLRDLLEAGWQINGVCFQRTEENGTVRRGAATTGGMVLWWNVEQQAQQEPVAYLYHDARTPKDAHPWLHSTMLVLAADRRPGLAGETPLYTSPPQRKPWVSLTDEDIANTCGFGEYTTTSTQLTLTHVSRAIEAKLREKNEAASEAQRKPLTDEQRTETINRAWNEYLRGKGGRSFGWYISEAIEAAHGIKGDA